MRSFQQFLLEYDRSKTIASLGQKFKSRLESDQDHSGPKNPEDMVKLLEFGDPTSNKQYVQWLVKAYANGSKAEDLVARGRGALAKFETLKKKKLLPAGQKDIGKLNNLTDLEDLVDSIDLPEEELKDKGKSREILNNSEVRIIVPHDEAAACYYGQGTRWCTAAKHNNMFQNYNGNGDLIIFLPKHPKHPGEKYQVHLTDEQWMDEKDEPIEPEDLQRRFPSVDFGEIGAKTGHIDDKNHHLEHIAREVLLAKLKAGTVSLRRVCTYAQYTIEGRWPEAEPYIMKDPGWAYDYARYVIKGRWPKAESYIIKSPLWAYEYALHIIEGRWPEAEPYIMKDPEWAYIYALDVIEGRWPEAEPYIMKDPQWAYSYAQNVIEGRWPEAEPYIMKSTRWAHLYAREVIKGPWSEANI